MIGHQTIGVHHQPEAIACFPNCLQEPAAVGSVAKARPPFVAAGRHVMRLPLELYAGRSGHAPPTWPTRRETSSVKS